MGRSSRCHPEAPRDTATPCSSHSGSVGSLLSDESGKGGETRHDWATSRLCGHGSGDKQAPSHVQGARWLCFCLVTAKGRSESSCLSRKVSGDGSDELRSHGRLSECRDGGLVLKAKVFTIDHRAALARLPHHLRLDNFLSFSLCCEREWEVSFSLPPHARRCESLTSMTKYLGRQ